MLSASAAIAAGWSPVGRYASEVLNGGIASSVAAHLAFSRWRGFEGADRANATHVAENSSGSKGPTGHVRGRTPAVSARAMAAPPYGSYAVIVGTFIAGLVAAGAASRRLGRDPQCQTSLDFVVLGAASFKAARTLARDEVTSFVRDPFVKGHAHEGGEEPVESGDMRQAIGELVTCSRCIGTWVAAGLAGTQILAPRFGRILSWSLAAAGANDYLQAAFAALTSKANELERRAAD